jgi:PAS domain S-box-containing protein
LILCSTKGTDLNLAVVDNVEATTDQLREELAVHRSLFENAVGGIYRSTPDGRYLEVNLALARMYGYEHPGELMNQVSDISHQIYVNPKYRDIFKREIQQHGVVRGLEYQVRRRDGSVIWISESARVVLGDRGEVRYYEGFIEDITARKEAERKLHESQQQLLETSRHVGMAEVATSILHNMGNAMNSINTSVSVASEQVQRSKVVSVGRVAALLRAHEASLGTYLEKDAKGRMIPDYLCQLAEHLAQEQAILLRELETLRKSVGHVNEIIAMQQGYARATGLAETVAVTELIDDALSMTANSLARHNVHVRIDYAPDLPQITVQKHKVLQILLNLIRNAQKACDGSTVEKQILLRVRSTRAKKWIKVEVVDNGIGIANSNLALIFSHGFTTRKDGHGFGLHSCALMAREMGGSLIAQSEGPGKGASFILEIPCQPADEKNQLKPGQATKAPAIPMCY